MTYILITRR